MTLAKTLLKLWSLRLWVGLGVLVGGVAAVGSVAISHSTVYATASSQLLVDSPNSALVNANVLLDSYVARAGVFARMMTSDEALQYIGKAAGINGNLIEATGPIEINGSPAATHTPVAIEDGKDLPAGKIYKLSFVQNPSLPTVDVYAAAPTTAQAIALANGAVTGFATFVNQLNGGTVPQSERVEIRQLGPATGGVVDPTASKSTAVLIFLVVFAIWCWLVLFVSRLRANLRAAKRGVANEHSAIPGSHLPELSPHPFAGDPPAFSPVGDGHSVDSNGRPFHRSLSNGVQSDNGSHSRRTFVRP
jgi:hypothetical protein